jgi:peptide/nickel transport system permease protein
VFLVPGDPARVVAGPRADATTLATIRRELGLDRSLPVQYGRYVGRLVHGDLGRSYATRQPVATTLARRLPATATLACAGLLIAVVVGLAGGLITAPFAGGWIDRAALVGSLAMLSAPVFWLGMLGLYYFGFRWRLVPLGGAGDVRHLVLPALVLGVGTGVYYARLLHTNLQEVLHQDYIRAARARGVGPLRLVGVHALRNAALPLLTVIGLDFAALMNGVVLTETVFHWPGLGRLAFDAVLALDVPIIMGTVLLSASLVVVTNLAVDLLYRLVDPRIRLG